MPPNDQLGWLSATIDGKFTVDAIAGEGGFGVVYRGTHLALRSPIAIKCLKIPSDLNESEQKTFLEAFQREARLLHQLSTRTTGIVQALDLGAATSPLGIWTPYVVMEWLDGDTLDAKLHRHPAGMEIDAAIEILTPVADALTIAHEEGVSHCDIKPSNVFLSRTRRGPITKILDFGLAEVFNGATTCRPSHVGDFAPIQAFTPQYAAPEQFDPRLGRTGPWTDVFALALLLIEAATGPRALEGVYLDELHQAAINPQKRPSLRARRPNTPEAIEAVVQKAVAVSSKLRWHNAGDFWNALRQACGTAPLLAPTVRPTMSSSPEVVPPAAAEASDALAATAPSAPRAHSGENRICTVLRVDLSDTNALFKRLDPAEVRDVLDRCVATMTTHVMAMRGDAMKHGSTGVVGVFGALPASDGNAERAAHAALRIVAAIAKLAMPRAARGIKPVVRIGIGTGRIFMEPAAGTTGTTSSVVGEAVMVADRLEEVAQLGTIVIDRATCRQLAGRFHVESLPPIDVNGASEQAFRLVGPAPARNVFSSHLFAGLDTKLVGRAAEKQRVNDVLETVIDERRAALVTLVGVPGIGRSRMLADIITGLTTDPRPIVLVTAQGSALTADTSYGLAISMLRARFGLSDIDPPGKILRRIRAGVRWVRARLRSHEAAEGYSQMPSALDGLDKEDLDDALVQIANLLGSHREGSSIGNALSLDERGMQAKFRITAAISRLVQFAATISPIILLVDDVQWADDATLDLLDQLVLRVEDLPLLIVCATRPELYDRRPHWGEGKTTHQRIDLGPLTRRHIEDMIRDRLRRVRDLPSEFVRTLAERADGNPFIVDEVMHLLLDASAIEVQGDTWSVHASRLGTLTLPPTIQGIVQARLDRLDARARATFGRAAVVGRTFWEGAVERLGRVDDIQISPASVHQDLARLRQRDFLKARDTSSFQGEREWIFAESATQEVAYEMLPSRVRRPMHLQVVQWLKERATSTAVAGLIALQADRGGDSATASREYMRAAAHASSLGQNAEALRLLLRAQEVHDETENPDAPPIESGHSYDDVRVIAWAERVQLRIELGDVLRRLGKVDEAEVAYEQARARIVRVERRRDVIVNFMEPLRWDARIDFRLAIAHKERGANARAEELVGRAIGRAREAYIVNETPEMYALLAMLLRRARRHAESRQAVLRGLRVCQSIPVQDERRRDGAARLLLALAPILYTSGHLVAAERTYRQVSRIATQAGNQDVLGRALNGVAAALLAQGAPARARTTFVQALRVKERAGDLLQLAVAYSNLAENENKLQEFSAALEHARRGVHLAEQIHARSDLAEMYRNVAVASLGLGQVEGALEAALAALSIAEESGRIYLDDVALCLARACARAGEAAASGSALHERAVKAAKTLAAALDRSFTDGALRQRADECRTMIGTLLGEASTG